MTLVLNEADVRQSCDIPGLVDALERGLALQTEAEVVLPPRMNLHNADTFMRLMPAIFPRAGLMGYKVFHGSMERGVRYLICLMSTESGEILALLDASYLTAARTGAASGVATRWMMPERPEVVGVLGSGLEAETNLRAVCAVAAPRQIRVFSRSQERRSAFAARMTAELGVEVTPADTPEATVKGTQIVIVATNTGHHGPPALEGRWLEPGQHVVSIGSTNPALREIDPQTFTIADRLVFDAPVEQIMEESGDLLAYRAESGADLPRIPVQLTDLAAGRRSVRESAEEITVYKSVGTGVQDLLAAAYVYERATQSGIGQDIGEAITKKLF